MNRVTHHLNLLLAFLLEIVLFIGIGILAYRWPGVGPLKYVYAFGLPVLVIMLWGLFAAPKSQHRLKLPALSIFKLVLFLGFAFLLYQAGHIGWALIYTALSLFCVLVEYLENRNSVA